MKVTIIDDRKGKHQSWEAELEHGRAGFHVHGIAYGEDEREARQEMVMQLTRLMEDVEGQLKCERAWLAQHREAS